MGARSLVGVLLVGCSFSVTSTPEDGRIVDGGEAVTVGFTREAADLNEAAGLVMIPVVLSAPADVPVTVSFTVGAASTATPADFGLTPGTLTFAIGEVQQQIELTLVADGVGDPGETIELVLASATGATLAIATQTLTLTEDPLACVGTGVYEVCPAGSPVPTITLPPSLDTGTSTLCEATQPIGWAAAGQPDVCLIYGGTITVTTTAVSGPRPLVLAATSRIDVSTLLDVASHRGTAVGPRAPGAPAPTCQTFMTVPGNSSSGGAGGAGATFRTKGADGGDGSGTNTQGRARNADATPLVLRAGCDGQLGGAGDGPAGAVGAGGGAVYLAAPTISIVGAINASGAGASPSAATKAGGSGGGSGGMIRIHASTLMVTGATLMANGGGGASGTGDAVNGDPGADPLVASPTIAAPGGAGAGGTSCRGGAGSVQAAAPANAPNCGTNNTGGGGGGGGGGFIHSALALTGATTSAGELQVP